MNKNMFVLFLALFLTGSFSACKTTRQERYVVVLSMDGFRDDYPGRGHTPTLDSLAKVGVRASFVPCFPSVTFPNHYSMATGLHPDNHGLVNNSFYDSTMQKMYRIKDREAVSNPAFYGGEPVWNTAERQGVKAATYFWVGSEAPVGGKHNSIWKVFDSSVPYNDRADSVVAWLSLPKEQRPHLVMWYIEEPDAIGHDATPDSSVVIDKVEELDAVLARFFSKVNKLDIAPKIDFIVTSDHGMATFVPDKYVNLGDYLPRDSFKFVFDGVPTVLYPKPGYTDTAYEILKKVPNITVWKKEEVPARYQYGSNARIGDLIVLPDVGCMVQFRDKGKPWLGGAHGYDNFDPTMQAIFYASGPSFKKNVTHPSLPNISLYPLICRLLKIKPAPNDADSVDLDGLLKK